MKSPWPSYVAGWHNDVYPAIDPARPELSHSGQTVVITGASAGIGSNIARAYATAGAAHVVLLARREPLLKELKAELESKFPKTKASYHVADVTDAGALQAAAAAVGKWDVLVLNAGYLAQVAPVTTTDVKDWWKGYEINVLGTVNAIQAFNPNKAPNAAFVGISTAAIMLGKELATYTSYQSSKFALTSMLETFAAEVPESRVFIIHPGVIQTDMYTKSKMTFPFDNELLPANFIVWSTSPEGSFSAGKMTSANWDVNDFISKKKEWLETPVHTANLVGFPWGFEAE